MAGRIQTRGALISATEWGRILHTLLGIVHCRREMSPTTRSERFPVNLLKLFIFFLGAQMACLLKVATGVVAVITLFGIVYRRRDESDTTKSEWFPINLLKLFLFFSDAQMADLLKVPWTLFECDEYGADGWRDADQSRIDFCDRMG
jgi:hypothetical protein